MTSSSENWKKYPALEEAEDKNRVGKRFKTKENVFRTETGINEKRKWIEKFSVHIEWLPTGRTLNSDNSIQEDRYKKNSDTPIVTGTYVPPMVYHCPQSIGLFCSPDFSLTLSLLRVFARECVHPSSKSG